MSKKISKKQEKFNAIVEGYKVLAEKHGRIDGDYLILDREPVPIQDICADAIVFDKGVLKFGYFQKGEWVFYRTQEDTKMECLEDTLGFMKKVYARHK